MSTIQEILDEDNIKDIPIEKVGIFRRFTNFVKKHVFKKEGKESARHKDTYSKFKHFFEEMDINDPSYMDVRHASTLCDDALRIATKRIRISKQLVVLTDKLSELEAFINLTTEEIDNLKKMLERFVALASERSVLLEKLTDYDASLVDMEQLKDDAKQIIPSIKDAEKHQRALRMDIGYLSIEKEELVSDLRVIEDTVAFMHKVAIYGIGGFFVIGVLLIFLQYFHVLNIFVPTLIFVFLVAGFSVLITMFRYRSQSEITMNRKKQQRAAELLNKKSVVYAYYTNFLRFCYKKYKARNSRILENNLKDLDSYRQLANRIDVVRSLMYETETSIERFLREKKLGMVRSTVEGFAKTINIDDKHRHFKEYSADKDLAEKTLGELDRRHEEIWNILMELNKNDSGTIVNRVIESYIDEAAKLFSKLDDPVEDKFEPRPIWKLFDLFEDGGLPAEAEQKAS